MTTKKIDGKEAVAKVINTTVDYMNGAMHDLVATAIKDRSDKFLDHYYEQALIDIKQFAAGFVVLSASVAFVKDDDLLNDFIADIDDAFQRYVEEYKLTQKAQYDNCIKARYVGNAGQIEVVCNEGTEGAISGVGYNYAETLLTVIDVLGSKITNTAIICDCTGLGCAIPPVPLKFESSPEGWCAVLSRFGQQYIGPTAETKFKALRRYVAKFANDQGANINFVVSNVN